jgi:hypothetical protein
MMDTRIRAKVIIPTLLFLALVLPALLIPIATGHDSDPAPPPVDETAGANPLDWETDGASRNFYWRVTPDEVSERLDQYLGGESP